ncbi:prepilin peptidase [Ochrobactrum sp. CM-21-5]|nr:prepilin peptidase [Ochrobactrum sp. CM-21-5]
MMIVSALLGTIFVAAMVTDLTSTTIRNRVTIGLAASFIILAPLVGLPLATYGWNLVADAVILVITFALFCLRAMGDGDAKLIAATALWFGFDPGLAVYLLKASILGGVLTLMLVLYRMTPRLLLADRYAFMARLARGRNLRGPTTTSIRPVTAPVIFWARSTASTARWKPDCRPVATMRRRIYLQMSGIRS